MKGRSIGDLLFCCAVLFAGLSGWVWLFCALQALAAGFVPGLSSAQPAPIYFGMSTRLTGPNASNGKDLALGFRAELAHTRDRALDGRRIALLVRDDGGDPQRTAANTRDLLQANVVALARYHGTRAIEAVLPLLDARNGTPLVRATNSAESLRTPPRRGLFIRQTATGYEAAAMVNHLATLGIDRITVIAQGDGLGRANWRASTSSWPASPSAL